MGTKGQLPPGAAGEGGAKQPRQNILWLTITKVAMIKFADWAKTSLSQQTYICYFGCELKALGTPLNRMLLLAPYTPKKEIGEGAHFRAPRTLVAPLLRSADWPHDTSSTSVAVQLATSSGRVGSGTFRIAQLVSRLRRFVPILRVEGAGRPTQPNHGFHFNTSWTGKLDSINVALLAYNSTQASCS